MYDKMVSIIVPVYNAEKYVHKCIDSLLQQTYKNIEIILINDGSTDNSGKICDEYANESSKIRVIHQKNSGPSATRNVGIDVANGAYIQFVDSDDYVEPNMTEEMLKAMNNKFQLVICGYKSLSLFNKDINIKEHKCHISGGYDYSSFMMEFGYLFRDVYINPLWNKLYNTALIKENHLRFKDNVYMGEDLLFNLEYIKKCNYINVINKYLYNYAVINSESLTISFKKDFFKTQQMLFTAIREFLKVDYFYNDSNKKMIEIAYTDTVVSCLEHLFHKDSNLTVNLRKENISSIVNNNCTRENIGYFKEGNIQKRFIGQLISLKSVSGIYVFFKAKSLLKQRGRTIFRLLKGLNK